MICHLEVLKHFFLHVLENKIEYVYVCLFNVQLKKKIFDIFDTKSGLKYCARLLKSEILHLPQAKC